MVFVSATCERGRTQEGSWSGASLLSPSEAWYCSASAATDMVLDGCASARVVEGGENEECVLSWRGRKERQVGPCQTFGTL
jgi:hypothetical protein